jgi:hypothetical protein
MRVLARAVHCITPLAARSTEPPFRHALIAARLEDVVFRAARGAACYHSAPQCQQLMLMVLPRGRCSPLVHIVQTERQLAATGCDDVETLSRLTVLLGQQVCPVAGFSTTHLGLPVQHSTRLCSARRATKQQAASR